MQRGKARPKTSRVPETTFKKSTSWAGMTVPPRMKAAYEQTYTVVQTLPPTTISVGTTGTAYGSVVPTVSALDNFSALGSVFDIYRVDWVEVTLRPSQNMNASGSSSDIATLITVIDYDDGTAPSSISYLNQYESALTTCFETQVRGFQPHVAPALYSGSFTSYGNIPCPWIDCASNTVQLYGLKYGLVNQTINTMLVHVNVRLKVSFKIVH